MWHHVLVTSYLICKPFLFFGFDALSLSLWFRVFHVSFRRYFTPGNMVLAGAGVDHAELVRLGEKYFGDLKAAGDGDSGSAGLLESRYHGGESRNIISADKVC